MRQQRKQQEKRLVEAERRAAQAAQKRSREQSTQTRTDDSDVPTFADRFLSAAFAFGKAVSVLVVAACFVSIAVCLVWLALVTPEKPQTVVPPFVPPTAAEYAAAVRAANAPSGSTLGDGGGNTGSRALTPSDTFDDILRQYGIDDSEIRMAFIRLDGEGQDALLTGRTLGSSRLSRGLASRQTQEQCFGTSERSGNGGRPCSSQGIRGTMRSPRRQPTP